MLPVEQFAWAGAAFLTPAERMRLRDVTQKRLLAKTGVFLRDQ